MVTEVIMQRNLLGGTVSQKSKSEFFSATELEKLGNKYRILNDMPLFNMNSYFNNGSTKEFITEIENKYQCKARIASRGKNQHTWVHPLIFIDMALNISPKLKLEVYEWITDYLLKYRNDSGDSYRDMSASVFKVITNKSTFTETIKDIACQIKLQCNVSDWQKATETQLKERDNIHRAIRLYSNVLKDLPTIVRLALAEGGKNG